MVKVSTSVSKVTGSTTAVSSEYFFQVIRFEKSKNNYFDLTTWITRPARCRSKSFLPFFSGYVDSTRKIVQTRMKIEKG